VVQTKPVMSWTNLSCPLVYVLSRVYTFEIKNSENKLCLRSFYVRPSKILQIVSGNEYRPSVFMKSVNIVLCIVTHDEGVREGKVFTFICLCVCLFYRTICQQSMQLGSPNLA